VTIGITIVPYAKIKVIPVIIWATTTISKSFRKYMSNVPGKHEMKN